MQGYVLHSEAYEAILREEIRSIVADPIAYCAENGPYFSTKSNRALAPHMLPASRNLHCEKGDDGGPFVTHTTHISGMDAAGGALLRSLRARKIAKRRHVQHSTNAPFWQSGAQVAYSMSDKLRRFRHQRIVVELCVFFGAQTSDPASLLEYLRALTRAIKVSMDSHHLLQMHLVVSRQNIKRVKNTISKIELQLDSYPIAINVSTVPSNVLPSYHTLTHFCLPFFLHTGH